MNLNPGQAGSERVILRGLVMRGAARLRHTLLSVVMLASLALALDGDPARIHSLTTKYSATAAVVRFWHRVRIWNARPGYL